MELLLVKTILLLKCERHCRGREAEEGGRNEAG